MNIKLARPLIWLLFIGYTSCLLYWMFLGFGRQMHTTGQLAYNVVPFRTIGNMCCMPIRFLPGLGSLICLVTLVFSLLMVYYFLIYFGLQDVMERSFCTLVVRL
ncbi:hypothetical protein [Paenibacillus andongensis]|uniref:hypothetical protein n=1 Tax=Paenibacillus andongensis TaxID=2975482 RepID=UPI0021BAC311|nr:hypothetical protein [Paenibacillus andongensis]